MKHSRRSIRWFGARLAASWSCVTRCCCPIAPPKMCEPPPARVVASGELVWILLPPLVRKKKREIVSSDFRFVFRTVSLASLPARPSVREPMATSDPGVDSPLALREKKAALNEVIELQRRLIEQREGSGGDNATNTSTSSDDEELRWYAEQTKRLEKFKHALNALRLQPDEFQLLVPASWAACLEDRCSCAAEG